MNHLIWVAVVVVAIVIFLFILLVIGDMLLKINAYIEEQKDKMECQHPNDEEDE